MDSGAGPSPLTQDLGDGLYSTLLSQLGVYLDITELILEKHYLWR